MRTRLGPTRLTTRSINPRVSRSRIIRVRLGASITLRSLRLVASMGDWPSMNRNMRHCCSVRLHERKIGRYSANTTSRALSKSMPSPLPGSANGRTSSNSSALFGFKPGTPLRDVATAIRSISLSPGSVQWTLSGPGDRLSFKLNVITRSDPSRSNCRGTISSSGNRVRPFLQKVT